MKCIAIGNTLNYHMIIFHSDLHIVILTYAYTIPHTPHSVLRMTTKKKTSSSNNKLKEFPYKEMYVNKIGELA